MPAHDLRAVPAADDNNREAAIRSIEEIHGMAEPLGVKVALEVMGNALSTAPDLIEIIERSFDGADLGICMDVGHAHLLGDTAEAIETTSEYLVTTHIHDNRRQSDDHLVPFQGSINWAATVMAFEKIGYDGVLMYEVRNAEIALARCSSKAVSARKRLEGADAGHVPAADRVRNSNDCLHRSNREKRGQAGHHPRMALTTAARAGRSTSCRCATAQDSSRPSCRRPRSATRSSSRPITCPRKPR